jgi:hypothetical protein
MNPLASAVRETAMMMTMMVVIATIQAKVHSMRN